MMSMLSRTIWQKKGSSSPRAQSMTRRALSGLMGVVRRYCSFFRSYIAAPFRVIMGSGRSTPSISSRTVAWEARVEMVNFAPSSISRFSSTLE